MTQPHQQKAAPASAERLWFTFAGIRPIDAPGFIVAQLAGAAAATLVFSVARAVAGHGCARRV
jgi:hypothetical protein